MSERWSAGRLTRWIVGFAAAYSVCAVLLLVVSISSLADSGPGRGDIHVIMVVLGAMITALGVAWIVVAVRASRRPD